MASRTSIANRGQSGGDPDKVGAHNGGDRVQVATFVPGEWHDVFDYNDRKILQSKIGDYLEFLGYPIE